MKRAVVVSAAAVLLLMLAFAYFRGGNAPSPRAADTAADADQLPIGAARMLDDGTIVMDLYMRHGEAVGHGQATYRKDHPEYARVLKHLGGLRPGEEKLVPPFPDE
ncbi:hypothetical protein [Massilia sp. METH4]|uniref:hypothetical protein n=1 Tax=Massilia sp. METH4 TaxID=3123041 RepID=UPI0030CAB6C3